MCNILGNLYSVSGSTNQLGGDMIGTKKKFRQALYNFLVSETAEPATTFAEFELQWAEWGMVVAIYNLGWMEGNTNGGVE